MSAFKELCNEWITYVDIQKDKLIHNLIVKKCKVVKNYKTKVTLSYGNDKQYM